MTRFHFRLCLFITFLLTVPCSVAEEPLPKLEVMAGQMLFMGFNGVSADEAWPQTLARQIREGQIGGVIMLGWNFETREGVLSLTKLFREAAIKRPIFIAVDQEGGMVQRLGPKLGYELQPAAETVGNTLSVKESAGVFDTLATMTREAGFNMNLAPVVDLRTDQDNPGIGDKKRTFSREPEVVARYAEVFIKAQLAQKVLPVLKHFPGHGSSTTDSHFDFVDVTETWSREELVPYVHLIDSQLAPAIMTGHLVHDKITTDGYPASLSKVALRDFLRKTLHHQGLIISDDLQMTAVQKAYSLEEAIILAINAGTDLLMITNTVNPDPELPGKLIAMIVKAVEDGKISKKRLEESWRRLEAAKVLIQ